MGFRTMDDRRAVWNNNDDDGAIRDRFGGATEPIDWRIVSKGTALHRDWMDGCETRFGALFCIKFKFATEFHMWQFRETIHCATLYQ